MSYNFFVFLILAIVVFIGLSIFITKKTVDNSSPVSKTLWVSRNGHDQVVHIVKTFKEDSTWFVSYESVNFGKLKILRHRRYADFKNNYQLLTSHEALKYLSKL